jgi:P-type E1-E2 ATPase
MKYPIPHSGELEINTIVLDLNGTLSVKGKIDKGVKPRITKLKKLGIEVILFTGDQRRLASKLCKKLGIKFTKADSSEEKEKLFLQLDTKTTAAIGNARIDIGKFKHAALSIATLQSEGIHTAILPYIDIIVPSINDALDLFIDGDSMKATMRK